MIASIVIFQFYDRALIGPRVEQAAEQTQTPTYSETLPPIQNPDEPTIPEEKEDECQTAEDCILACTCTCYGINEKWPVCGTDPIDCSLEGITGCDCVNNACTEIRE